MRMSAPRLRFGFKAGARVAERRHKAEIAETIRRLQQDLSGMETLAEVTDAQIAYARTIAAAYEERTEATMH